MTGDFVEPAVPADEFLVRRTYRRQDVEALAEQYRNWGRWGPDDELGAANLVTPSTIRAAASLVRTGKTFSLAIPLDRRGPQVGTGQRVNPQYMLLVGPSDTRRDDGGLQKFTDDAVYMPLQAGTQWDAFCHAFYDGQSYNGQDYSTITTYSGATKNSITNFGDRAVGRGVLLDIPRLLGRRWLDDGESIQGQDLERCAQAQGIEVREGDFVLVRTGQLLQRREQGSWADYAGGSAPGLGVSAAEFLCTRHVVAVSTDTWGVEAKPYETNDIMAPLHVILLVNAGVYMGEMWDLEALAEDCAVDGTYEFLLVAPPLTITGAVGSPLNPIAIK